MSYGQGVTQCPKCGSVATFPITLTNGGQVLNCKSCHKNFTAEVQQKQFTGRYWQVNVSRPQQSAP